MVLVSVVACGDKTATSSNTSAAPASASAAARASSATVETAALAKTAEVKVAEPGSIAELRERATGVMAALKKGDAKAAADYCLGKHRPGLEKFITETIEKKEQSRSRAYLAWDGTLGEIRIEGDLARVAFGKDEKAGIDYLSFRKKELGWSLDDIPVTPKASWDKWGKVASE